MAQQGEAQTSAGADSHPGGEARAWLVLPLLCGFAFVLMAFDAARLETPTIDEFAHVPAGFAYLDAGRFELYAKSPPWMQVLLALPAAALQQVEVPEPRSTAQNWGPWLYGYQFMSANVENYFAIFTLARTVSIAMVCITALLLFVWARRLFGLRGASLAASLFLLSPMLLAHGHLATVDVGCMASVFAVIFCLRWACERPGALRMAATGLALGAALLVKFTALLLVPAVVALILWHGRTNKRRAVLYAVTVLASALFLVNAGMGFEGSMRSLGSFEPSSELIAGLRAALPAWLPVPLPEDYLLGFDAVRVDTERGEFGSYLLGEWTQEGRWYYNLVAFALKTPLPLLALILVSPWFLLRSGVRGRELSFLLVPPLLLIVMMAGFNRAGIGLRYLLPAYPFLFVSVASIWMHAGRRTGALLAVGLVAYYALLAATLHPAHLSYFNVFAGGPEGGHRYLVDSNLDWGQDLYRLQPALDELGVREPIGLLYFGHVHPAMYGISYRLIPPRPQPGVFAVSTTFLMGNPYVATAPDGSIVSIGRDHAAWLRDRTPVRREASIWIFDTRSSEAGW